MFCFSFFLFLSETELKARREDDRVELEAKLVSEELRGGRAGNQYFLLAHSQARLCRNVTLSILLG